MSKNVAVTGAGLWRLAFSAILAAGGLVYAFRLGNNVAGIDFYQFWAGAQVARQAGSDLYDSSTRRFAAQDFRHRAYTTEKSDRMVAAANAREQFEFFSTPFLYTCFGLFTGDYDRDLLLFRILSLAATAAAVVLLCRAAGLTLAQAFLIVAFLTLLFQPLKSGIRVGNVNQLQLLMLSAAIFMIPRRAFVAGVILGVAVAFKPNVALTLPLLALARVVERDWRRLAVEMGGAATGIAGAIGVSSLYFGSFSAWRHWLRAAGDLAGTLLLRSEGNIALALPLAHRFGARAGWMIAIIAIAIILWSVARKRRLGQIVPAMMVALGVAVYVLSSTLVWLHYLVLAVPLAITLMGSMQPFVGRAIAFVALTLIAFDPWMYLLQVRTTSGESTAVWIGVIALFGTAILNTERLIAGDALVSGVDVEPSIAKKSKQRRVELSR